jgi:hypothetical protein
MMKHVLDARRVRHPCKISQFFAEAADFSSTEADQECRLVPALTDGRRAVCRAATSSTARKALPFLWKPISAFGQFAFDERVGR